MVRGPSSGGRKLWFNRAMRKHIRYRCMAAAVVLTLASIAIPARADDVSPPAREWRSYCQAYIKALEGDSAASDLDLTYCLGVTKGLLNGMRVGSQLGALSFASRVAKTFVRISASVFSVVTDGAVWNSA